MFKFIDYIIISIIIIIGIILYKDFGISTDEPVNRNNGAVSAKYVVNKINDKLNLNILSDDSEFKSIKDDLLEYHDRDYGVAIDLPIYILERILKINNSHDQYLFRHLAIYLIFIIGGISLFLLIKKLTNNRFIAYIGLSMLFLNPRLFAESFYNIKDITFMSLFSISMYSMNKLIDDINVKNLLFHSIISAISIDLRIIGIIIPSITVILISVNYFRLKINIKKTIIYITNYLILCGFIVILFWPWLWSDPFNRFIEAFINMSRFRWDGWILFKGIQYPAGHLPWYYLSYWILISTPLLYTILFVISLVKLFLDTLTSIKVRKTNTEQLKYISFVVLLICPISVVIIFRSVVYDGWRQFYFIYPLIILISTYGIKFIFDLKILSLKFKNIFTIIFVIHAIYIVTYIYNSHPYSNVYFNVLAGKNWNQKFESDYWGLSNTKGLMEILNHDNSKEINIWPLGHTSLSESILFIDSPRKHTLKKVDSIESANYVIYNYRDVHPNASVIYKKLASQYPIFYEITVDNNSILTIFKVN